MDEAHVSLVVLKSHVKTVKTALEAQKKLDPKSKMIPHLCNCESSKPELETMIIPTTFVVHHGTYAPFAKQKAMILESLKLSNIAEDVTISTRRSTFKQDTPKVFANPFLKAVHKCLMSLPSELFTSIDLEVELLLSKLPTTYSIYKPMLLLPKHTFQDPGWTSLLSAMSQTQTQHFYQSIAESMKVTHLATNAPIPPATFSKTVEVTKMDENFLRSPLHFQPILGDFGPDISASIPTTKDFARAFWVSTRQNGITQVWAPRYTMFSRGNISEKSRVLGLSSVADAVEQGVDDGRSCAAVDLYAGIGYFAFSYAKAGVAKVLCWELNPWSVEGFRRGADKNKWTVTVVKEGDSEPYKLAEDPNTFVVFQMDNRKAKTMIERWRSSIPPIRHVNCGLLPTSKGSWETAVGALDPELGGWIHLHENIATKDIEIQSEQIAEQIQVIIDNVYSTSGERSSRKIAIVDHVEKVKTYAPGVMHCVLDIYISNIRLRN